MKAQSPRNIVAALGGVFFLWIFFFGLLVVVTSQPIPGRIFPENVRKLPNWQIRLGTRLAENEVDPDAMGRAILAHTVNIDTEQFPVFSYRITGMAGALQASLFWRSRSAPQTLKFAFLPHPNGNQQSIRLDHNPDWHGPIIEIGLVVQPATQTIKRFDSRPVHVLDAALESYSFSGLLNIARSNWWAYRGWRGSSINRLGNWRAPYLAILALALSLAALYRPWRRLPQITRLGVVAASIVLVWSVFDWQWSNNLWTVNAETRHQFAAAKTGNEQRAHSNPGALVEFVSRIQPVLQGQAGRVFLKGPQRFFVARLKYLMAPVRCVIWQGERSAAALRVGDVIVEYAPGPDGPPLQLGGHILQAIYSDSNGRVFLVGAQ